MDFLFCLLVQLGLVNVCFGWALPFSGGSINYILEPGDENQRCPADDKPCAILVRQYELDGTFKQQYSTEVCSCGSGTNCSLDWGVDPDKTIKRYLKTNDQDLILEMRFCRTVQPLAVCSPYQLALSLKGQTIIPQELNSINCRCPHNEPLHLQKVWFERFMERHQNFVCSMPTCDVPTDSQRIPCFLTFEQRAPRRHETTYICNCPEHFRCVSPQSSVSSEISLGYCQRRTQ